MATQSGLCSQHRLPARGAGMTPRGAIWRARVAEGVVSRDFGDEYVVLNTVTNQAHALQGNVATVWRSLCEGTSPGLPDEQVDEALQAIVAMGLAVAPTGMIETVDTQDRWTRGRREHHHDCPTRSRRRVEQRHALHHSDPRQRCRRHRSHDRRRQLRLQLHPQCARSTDRP